MLTGHFMADKSVGVEFGLKSKAQACKQRSFCMVPLEE